MLHASHEPDIEQLQDSLLSCCKNSNLTVIKTIIADNGDDCEVLTGLIDFIKSQNDPINLIVTNNSLNDLFHIFTYTVIATLLEAKLINRLYIYQDEKSQTTNNSKLADPKSYTTNKEKLLEVEKSLLPFCAEYYRAMATINKIELD